MKRFFTLGLLGCFGILNSAFAQSLICVPNSHESQLFLNWGESRVTARVSVPMGYSYLPQLEGPVSEASIPFLKMQAEGLRLLGADFEVSWPRERCRQSGTTPFLFECDGRGEVSPPGKIEVYGMSGRALLDEGLDSSQKFFQLRIVFSQENIYFMTLRFAEKYCS